MRDSKITRNALTNVGEYRLAVRLTPRAAKARIGGTWTDAHGATWLSAWVTAPPDKGRANAALIDLLAEALDVPASAISLESGATSRLKRLRVDGMNADIAARLARLMERP